MELINHFFHHLQLITYEFQREQAQKCMKRGNQTVIIALAMLKVPIL